MRLFLPLTLLTVLTFAGAAGAEKSLPFPTGPEVGSPLPDFTLHDQNGAAVNFTQARAGKKALVVLFRSAAW